MEYKKINIKDLNRNSGKEGQEKLNKIKLALLKDYELDLEKDDSGRWLYKDAKAKDKKPLWSPSRMMKTFMENTLYNIPPYILNPLKNNGIRLMENIEYSFKNELTNYDGLSNYEGDMARFHAINNFMNNNKIKVLAVEKLLHNYNCMGIVDMIVYYKGTIYIVEIKTRTKDEVRASDLFQVRWYSNLLHKAPVLLLILDKENNVNCYKVDLKTGRKGFNSYIKYVNDFVYLDIETPVEIDNE